MMPQMDGLELTRRIREDPAISDTPLIVLTSGGDLRIDHPLRAMGIQAILTKPVRQTELCRILISLISAHARKRPAPAPMIDCKSGSTIASEAATETSLRILLAEDNPVNQKVVSTMLQRRGHEVSLVNNGREAVESCRQKRYDLIFMDIQMPEMDGFEALASIRTWEKGENRSSLTPVIALTAHAMKGDQELCLDAGFDGYLTKPVSSADLDKVVTAFASRGPEPARDIPDSGFDRSFALEQAGGDESLLQELIDLFLDRAPEQLQRVRDEIDQDDCQSTARSTHLLKGSLSLFLDPESLAPLHELERLSKAGRMDQARKQFASVEKLTADLLAMLSRTGSLAAEPILTLPDQIDHQLSIF